jgi:hypothetical protein
MLGNVADLPSLMSLPVIAVKLWCWQKDIVRLSTYREGFTSTLLKRLINSPNHCFVEN